MPPHLLVIGSGPGGEAAAKCAVARGASVTLIEKGVLGGLCLNWGCIPSKALLEAGRLQHLTRAGGDVLRMSTPPRVDWNVLQKRKDALVEQLRGSLVSNYSRLKIRVVQGAARFLSPRSVEVVTTAGVETISFDAAVLATGSAPFFPPPFDVLRDQIIDSDRALSLDKVPARLVVVGGGAVGCEFACLFQELGSSVTVIEKKDTLLPGEDPAVVRVLQAALESRGARVLTGTHVTAATRGAEWSVTLANGETLAADHVLVCVGRRPTVDGLNIDAAEVVLENGRPRVNEFLLTSNPAVYAVGDVNGLSLLAHAAAAQGETAVDHFLGSARPYRNDRVPRCLYTWPEVASVGEWADGARARGVTVKAQRFFFRGSPKALASGETDGFVQILSDGSNEKLLGAQIVGPHATELIHVFAVALGADMTTEELRHVIFAHPTLSEGIREALSR